MRPRYETEQDLQNEGAIGLAFCERFNLTQHKLPEGRYTVDVGVFQSGRLVAVIEIKNRPGWKPSYGDVFLGLSKVRELVTCNDLLGVPAYFVARLDKSIYYVKVDERVKDWHITWGGRTDRGDPEDLEPVVHIPFAAFVPLSK